MKRLLFFIFFIVGCSSHQQPTPLLSTDTSGTITQDTGQIRFIDSSIIPNVITWFRIHSCWVDSVLVDDENHAIYIYYPDGSIDSMFTQKRWKHDGAIELPPMERLDYLNNKQIIAVND